MKKLTLVLAAAAMVGFAGPAMAGHDGGLGIHLSGPHYNLNLRGGEQCPGDDIKGTNTHVIHVSLNYSDANPNNNLGDGDQFLSGIDKTNKIFLQEGDDFQVIDGNACDGDGAKFQLPANPCADGDTTDGICTDPTTFTEYQVYVRALGGKGSGSLTTCAWADSEAGADELICSSESVELTSNGKGSKPRWENVTKELTTIVADIDPTAAGSNIKRVEIFSSEYEGYYWDYDNNGLVLVQLRFYPILN